MKKGEHLRDYLITTAPSNDRAGKCMWAFAEKDGREYFVKEFLEPKRPHRNSMGSPESKRLLLRQCDEFERRHWAVIERIDPHDLDAGNLVTALDFFCEGTKYYKVSRRLYAADLADPHHLTATQKRVLLSTLGESLRLLHRLRIVHGDLKPQNVLLHRPPGSDLYTAKLIDFDDAYLAGHPVDAEIGGDALYGAPELVRYLQKDPGTGPEDLTTAADMFAFGLLLHVYLTGALPRYPAQFASPAEAVNAGAALDVDPRLHAEVAAAVRSLTTADPAGRPRIGDTLPLVSNPDVLGLTGTGSRLRISTGRRPAGRPGGERGSRLRINLGRDEPGVPPADSGPPPREAPGPPKEGRV